MAGGWEMSGDAFGKVDQRLATLERLHVPAPPAPDPVN